MSLRLRLLCDGTMAEYIFDRDKVELGRAPSNDLIIASGAVPSHQGALVLDGERLSFESYGSGQSVLLVRDGSVVSESEGFDEMVFTLEVGDFLLLDGHDVRVEILSVEHTRSPAWRGLVLPEAQTPSPLALSSLLRLTQQAHADQEPTSELERALGALAAVVEAFGLNVLKATVSLRRPEEPFDEAYALVLGGVDSSEVFDVTHDPLARFGPAIAQELRVLLAQERVIISSVLPSGAVILYAGLLELGELLGVLALELASVEEVQLERLLKEGALPWWQMSFASIVERHEQRAALLNLVEENRYFLERERRHYLFKELICESAAMRAVYEQVNAMVAQDDAVVILGEAGSGKELLARALHHLGPRRERMFISLHCGRLSDEQLGVELFGCVASVLAGAVASRKGIFELATDGTVYLEEVHLLSSALQSKLVRMLKEGELRRIGDAVGRKVSARLIVSTHHELRELVQGGKLRQDLYLLLKDHALVVPALRERREDLMSLARIFLRKFAKRYDRKVTRFDDEVVEALMAHDWPGNVRALQAFIEAAVLKAPPDADSLTLQELRI